MAGLNVRFVELSHQRVEFEAMALRVGSDKAKTAFARAMTHEGRKANTAVKRKLRERTSIKMADINRAVSFRAASKREIATITKGRGYPLPVKYFGARQFKEGVRARIWGRTQRFPGAFIVKSIGGNVFKRTGQWNRKSKRFNAIEKLWGPSIPTEMLTEEIVDAFTGHIDGVAKRAMHELSRIMNA